MMTSYASFAQPVAKKGVFDISDINLLTSPSFNLEGEWEFYWNELKAPGTFDSTEVTYIQFPTLWNDNEGFDAFGYATYRLRVLLPEHSPPVGFTIPDFYSAYAMYVNGELFSVNGKVGTSKDSYTPHWLPKTLALMPPKTGELDIVLHISNFDHSKGGASQQIVLGTDEALFNWREKEIGYSYLLTGSLLMGGLFFLGLYLFGRHDMPILYFSLFCIVYSYRIFGFDIYALHALVPNVPWIVTLRLEYITLFLSPYLFGLYTRTLYPKESSQIMMDILSWICLLCIAISLFLPPFYFTQLVLPFFIILSAYIFYAFWIYAKATQNKRDGSGFALASTGVVFVVLFWNILQYFGFVEKSLLLNFTGYLSFFFFQSLILSYRFASYLKRAKLRAEAASTSKSQFLSTMSHEIRTPLNAVIGLSGLMINTDLDKEQEEFAKTIKRSGENLLHIINNILDFSKIENGNLEVEDEEVRLELLIDEVIDLLSPLSQRKGLEIIKKIDSSMPHFIYTDGRLVQQVLINLVGNAIKFTDQGSVTIHAHESTEEKYRGNIQFDVIDTGIGVTEEQSGKLFRRFSQVDASASRKYGGTGLGLAISKKIVQALEGDIWLNQNSDKGSVFSFKISAKKSNRIYYPASDISFTRTNQINIFDSVDQEKLTILIVEDNLVNQVVAQKMLERLGFESDIAQNGKEALAMTQQKHYNIILMDIEMPVMDGFEATKHMRERDHRLNQHSTIIAMTANAMQEDKERCLAAGMDDFISKPVTLNSIESVLSKWVNTFKN